MIQKRKIAYEIPLTSYFKTRFQIKAGEIMDNFSIERVWEDEHMFEIEVVAQSKFIHAKAKIYIQTEGINDLALALEPFPKNLNEKYLWEVGECSDVCSFVSLNFSCEDKCGHIIVEVQMDINDGTPQSKHNCHLFIKTEAGLLNRFGKSLSLLKERGIGKKITLHQIDE